MAAITGTKTLGTEASGKYKLVVITATIESASDTITLTEADHGISAITAIVGAVITGGQDAEFMAIQASFSGLVLTLESVGQDGLDSTAWSDTTIAIAVIGTI